MFVYILTCCQVLRYDKGGKPLWVSSECVPAAKDIPKCSCGEDRQFEFQVVHRFFKKILNCQRFTKKIDSRIINFKHK